MKTYYVVWNFGDKRYRNNEDKRIIDITDDKKRAEYVRSIYWRNHSDYRIEIEEYHDDEMINEAMWYVLIVREKGTNEFTENYACLWFDWEDRDATDKPGIYDYEEEDEDGDTSCYVLVYARDKFQAISRALDMVEEYNEIEYK